MSGPIRLRATIVIFSLFWSAILHAAPICADLFRTYAEGGASVELEMKTTENVLQILTTHDGLVGSLFDRKFTDANYPESYIQWAQKNYPDTNPRSLEWDVLPDSQKRLLIQTVARAKTSHFYEDRQVPGIKVKDVLTLTFPVKTVFLGKVYSPGVHQVDVSQVFKQVEFRSRQDVEAFSGVELHMRSKDHHAGDLLQDAWSFQLGIGEKKTHLHEHIVVRAPVGKRKRETSLEIAEYYRRANLLAELMKAADHGVIMSSKNLATGETFFDVARPSFFSGVFRYLSEGLTEIKGSAYKMAYVGFRTQKTYDQEQVFGFEYRAIGKQRHPQLISKITDQIQYALRNQRYGFDYAELTDWFATKDLDINNDKDVAKGLESAWYHESYTKLYKRLPLELKESLGKPGWALLQAYRMKISDYGNHALKMLLYDWASDPIYANDPVAQQRVRKAQVFALKNLFKNEEVHPRDMVSIFVKTSGLLEQVGRTFDLTPQELQRLQVDE